MRKLIIMRHGKSSWDNPSLSDIERPLKKRGMNEAAKVAEQLIKLDAVPDLILTSPATRARDTAIIIAQQLGYDIQKLQIDPSIYGAGTSDIFRILSFVNSEPESIMIFGHNPTFTQLINRLQEDYLDNLPTCGCFGFRLEIDSWSEVQNCGASNWFKIIPSKLK